MRVIRLAAIIMLTTLASMMSGCGSLGVGEEEFACPGRPSGVRCASATEIYAATENSDSVNATSLEALGDDPVAAEESIRDNSEDEDTDDGGLFDEDPDDDFFTEGKDSSADVKKPTKGKVKVSKTYSVVPEIERPLPIRTPARVMRVWVAPWEDKRGVLHVSGYHFIEIESRRWNIGEESISEPSRFFTLQAKDKGSEKNGGSDQRGKGARAGSKP